MRATAATQISAFLANTPGVVAHLYASLAEHGVNVQAMTVLDTVDIGTMRMVVDDVDLAKRTLDAAGAAYVEVPVLSVAIPNAAGGFARIARALAGAHINIDYFYATASHGSNHTVGIFRVSDRDAALEIDFNL